MDEAPGYREWLEQDRRSRERAKVRFGGAQDPQEEYRDDRGHPVNAPLPSTGDQAYDGATPRRQAHSRAAREVAGFDAGTVDRVRAALDAGEEPEVPRGWKLQRGESRDTGTGR